MEDLVLLLAGTVLGTMSSIAVSWWFASQSTRDLYEETLRLSRQISILATFIETTGIGRDGIEISRDEDGAITGVTLHVQSVTLSGEGTLSATPLIVMRASGTFNGEGGMTADGRVVDIDESTSDENHPA